MNELISCCADPSGNDYRGDYVPKWMPYDQYLSDGSTKVYVFTFQLLVPTNLGVYVTAPGISPNPVVDKLILHTDYVIRTYTDKDGGVIELAKTYEKGSVITITLQSNYVLATNFKEGRTFSGAELDLTFKQVSLYLQELALLYSMVIKYPINTIDKDESRTLVPMLKDDHIWVGSNGRIIQVPLPDGSKGDVTCCDVLRAQLANNDQATDGARMIGVYDQINNLHTNLSAMINNLNKKINGINTIPKPKEDEVCLPLISTADGKVVWDKSVIGNIIQSISKRPQTFMDKYGLLYADGSSYYSFDKSPVGIPYSRLANTWWRQEAGTFLFGGAPDQHQACVLQDKNGKDYFYVVLNDAKEPLVVVDDNVDIKIVHGSDLNFKQTEASKIMDAARIEIFENDVSTGEFNDGATPTGVSGMELSFFPNRKGNSYVLNFAKAKLDMKGGEFFTVLGILVWYTVNGKGTKPSTKDVRRVVNVDLPTSYSLDQLVHLTKFSIRGNDIYTIDLNFRENAMFSLKTPHVQIFLKYGDYNVKYTHNRITITVPKSATYRDKALYIRNGINRYTFCIPDLRDLHLRGGDARSVDYMKPSWRNIERYKRIKRQYGGVCISDSIKHHGHNYAFYGGWTWGKPMGLRRETKGSVDTYQVEIQPTGTTENRVASHEAFFYVKY